MLVPHWIIVVKALKADRKIISEGEKGKGVILKRVQPRASLAYVASRMWKGLYRGGVAQPALLTKWGIVTVSATMRHAWGGIDVGQVGGGFESLAVG